MPYFRTAPKIHSDAYVKRHMDIGMHHFLGALYGFMRIFSNFLSLPYDFILNNFPAYFICWRCSKLEMQNLNYNFA